MKQEQGFKTLTEVEMNSVNGGGGDQWGGQKAKYGSNSWKNSSWDDEYYFGVNDCSCGKNHGVNFKPGRLSVSTTTYYPTTSNYKSSGGWSQSFSNDNCCN
jgi:hypothetical protein